MSSAPTGTPSSVANTDSRTFTRRTSSRHASRCAATTNIRRTSIGWPPVPRPCSRASRCACSRPTSGSASATKLIPYPASLQREFQRGIQPWIADLFLHRPDLMRGQAYWSVSPATSSNRRTSGGIPIGFEDDSHYVGGWRRRLVQAVMAVPPTLRHVAEIDTFQHLTLLSLVRSGSLRIISVWNPTFLLVLLDRLTSHAEAVARDLHGDTMRRNVLRRALRAATPAERHAILWPDLGLISCWADANASEPSAAVSQLFPHAAVQGKGLVATEGFVSSRRSVTTARRCRSARTSSSSLRSIPTGTNPRARRSWPTSSNADVNTRSSSRPAAACIGIASAM